MAFDLESARPIVEAPSKKETKKSGSFDLSSAKPASSKSATGILGLKQREQETEQAISKRPKIQQELSSIAEQFTKGGIGGKAMAGLRTVGIPLQLVESAVANPALAMQKGNFNPIELAKQAALGISGQRMGEYGDVGRIAGYGDVGSGAMGLALGVVSPVTAARKAQKFFGAVAKWSDKNILKAGESLIKASDNAVATMGKETEKVFQVVGDAKASGKEALSIVDRFKKVPQLTSAIEEELGKPLVSILKDPSVANLRTLKQVVGKYRPNIFGKEQRGLAENIEAENINKLYGHLKTVLHDSIKRGYGDKAAKSAMDAEKAFSRTKNASDYIRKTITDPTLKEATKGGSMAKKIIVEGDVSGRTALNRIKEASSVSRREINRAVNALQAFNSTQAMAKFGQHAAQAAFFGGAVGGLGGMVAGKAIGRGQD